MALNARGHLIETVAMKRQWAFLALGLLALPGCAEHYVVKLSNGAQITTPHKPKMVNGTYQYTDSLGHRQMLPASRVREIEPASMAKEEQEPFKPVVHKKRHWYLLWLG